MLAFVYLTDQSESDQYLREVVERWFRMFAATSFLNICIFVAICRLWVSFLDYLLLNHWMSVERMPTKPIARSWKADPIKDSAVQKSLQKPTHLHWTLLYNWKIIDSRFLIYTVHTFTPGVCIFHEWPYLTHDTCPSFIYVVFTLVLWNIVVLTWESIFFLLFS